MPSLVKGIDPVLAAEELARIEKAYGSLKAEYVLEAAKSEDSVLHNAFNWDDKSAAHSYRIAQARNIINNIEVQVISDGQARQVPAYEIVTVPETGRIYKNVQDFDGNDVEQIRMQAVRELNYWRNKLALYSKFSKAAGKIGEAVDEIGNE